MIELLDYTIPETAGITHQNAKTIKSKPFAFPENMDVKIIIDVNIRFSYKHNQVVSSVCFLHWITPLRPLARLYYIVILVMSIFVM